MRIKRHTSCRQPDEKTLEHLKYVNRRMLTSTVTRAAAIVLDTLNVDESTILTVPPSSRVAFILESANVYGSGVSFGITTSSSALSGGGGAGKMYNSLDGMRSNADISTWKFFAITSENEVALLQPKVIKR